MQSAVISRMALRPRISLRCMKTLAYLLSKFIGIPYLNAFLIAEICAEAIHRYIDLSQTW